jgi:hypothetical protein
MPDAKVIVRYFIVIVVSFLFGFGARGLFDGSGVHRADEYHQTIENELRTTDGISVELERNIAETGSGITGGIERVREIGSGLDGIEKLADENTELLESALRILLDAGDRERPPQAE